MASIYERSPRSRPYTVTVGGGQLNEWLGGWSANSAIVDNHASQHLLLPDVEVYCPPLIVGRVVPLPDLGRVIAQFATPPGYSPMVAAANQIAVVTFFADELSPHPGVPDGVTSSQQSPDLATISVTGAPKNGTIPLPAGTQSLSIVTMVTAGDTSSLGLTGVTTGFGYYGQQLGTSAYEIIGVDAAADPSLNYTASHGAGSGVTWNIRALPFPPPSFIGRLPAPWQAPFNDATLNQNIGHGTSFTWITPPAGEALRLFHCFLHWRTSTAGFGRIMGSGNSGVLRQYDQVATNFLEYDFKGRRLAVNETLQITNDDAGNGQSINGGIGFSTD